MLLAKITFCSRDKSHDKHQEHLIVSRFKPSLNGKRDFECMDQSLEYVDKAM